jgi:hypothetical protein
VTVERSPSTTCAGRSPRYAITLRRRRSGPSFDVLAAGGGEGASPDASTGEARTRTTWIGIAPRPRREPADDPGAARSVAERAPIAAFAVRGLAERLAGGTEDETHVDQALRRHADWLEVATPYAVYPFVPPRPTWQDGSRRGGRR